MEEHLERTYFQAALLLNVQLDQLFVFGNVFCRRGFI